jgi:hypothetical protein
LTHFQAALAVGLVLMAPVVVAQGDLGALLDRGATKLSVGEFKENLVQIVLVGGTDSGGNLEIMYAANGVVQGVGTHPLFTGLPLGKIYGEWAIDDAGRICTTNARIGKISLRDRCQFWFKVDGQYFVADSDSNRRAEVHIRAVKP